MSAIAFRPQSLLRDQRPAPGAVDNFGVQLVELGQRVSDMEDDDATSTVRPAALDALGDVANIRRFVWQLSDKWQARSGEFSSMQRRAAEEARRGVPGFGHGSGANYELARDGAANDATKRFQQGITDDLQEKYGAKGDAVVASAVQSLRGLINAIDEARTDHDSPKGVRLEDLAVQAEWETRMRAAKDPIVYAQEKLASLIRHQKDEQLRTFIPAAQKVGVAWMTGKLTDRTARSLERRQGHWEAAPDFQARELLRQIAQYRASGEPPSIAVVEGVLYGLKNVFTGLVGMHASFQTPDERRTRYYVDTSQKEEWPEGAVDKSWFGRYLPPNGQALPGYTRPVGKTDGGVVVRESPPRPLVAAEVEVQ